VQKLWGLKQGMEALKKAAVFASFLIYAAFFCAAFIFSDTIIMKNGKKTEGVIIEYTDGQYVFKSGEKKYYMPESMADKIYWNATRSQLDAAYEGEGQLDILQAHSKNLWWCAEPLAGLLFVSNEGNRGMLAGTEVYGGAAIGIQQKSGRGTGRDGSVRGLEYLLPAQYMLNITYGSISGDISYKEPGAAGDSTTALSSSNVMFMLHGFYRHSLPVPLLYFFWGMGLGLTVNSDTLDSYPMGWKDFESLMPWMYDPALVDEIKYSGMYLGVAVRAVAGLQFEVNDLFFINVCGGYLGRSKQRYDDPFKYGDSFEAMDSRASQKTGGWYFDASTKFLF
jgi:hypothetical protein